MHGHLQATIGNSRRADSIGASWGDWFAHSRVALTLVWLAYLLPRVLILLVPVKPVSDAAWYYDRAADIAAGLGYLSDGAPTAFWPPGQSLALGAVFWCFGTSTTAVGLFNLFMGMVGGWLTYDFGRRIFASPQAPQEAVGRAGLLLLAIYPNAIGYYPLALTEVFYTTLLLACCWLLVVRGSVGALLLAGVLFGVASLVKAQTILVIPLALAIALSRQAQSTREVLARMPAVSGRAALLVVVAALTVLPWTIRNHAALGQWVPVSTNGGLTLFTGNNDSALGDYTPDDPAVTALRARKDLDEVAMDAEAKRLAVAWIRAHPSRFIALGPLKLGRLWGPDGESAWSYESGSPAFVRFPGIFWALRYANQVYYMAMLAGFAGAFAFLVRRSWRDGKRWLGLVDWWLLPYGIAAYPSIIALVFSGQSRFHYPVMPFVCMTCGWLLVELLRRGRLENTPRQC